MTRRALWTALLLCLSPALATVVSQRDVAEWVIRQGGRVILAGSRNPVGDVVKLPAGDLSIRGVDLSGTLLEPKDLEKIGSLPSYASSICPDQAGIPEPAAGSTPTRS